MQGLNALYYEGHTSMDISSALGRDRAQYEELTSKIKSVQENNKEIMDAIQQGRLTMGGRSQEVMAVRTLRPQSYGNAQDTYVKRGNTAVCVFNSFNTRAQDAWEAFYAGKGPKPNIKDYNGDSMVIRPRLIQRSRIS